MCGPSSGVFPEAVGLEQVEQESMEGEDRVENLLVGPSELMCPLPSLPLPLPATSGQ